MIIQLNGKSADIPEEIVTLQDLLVWYGLKDRIVIAELNREIIDKKTINLQPLLIGIY